MVLWEAVQALPPRQRAVVVLRYKEDLTEAEVARLLGLPVGTVKSASHRALARLRERLGSFDRFLRRRTRRGRVVAAAAALALVGVVAGAVLVPRLRPSHVVPAAPGPTKVRVENQGFELQLPSAWKVERELTVIRAQDRVGTPPGTSLGPPGPVVVGVVLVPRSGRPDGARITVTANDNQQLDYSAVQGGSRRADGRQYKFHPGSGSGDVGRYAVLWPDWCPMGGGCSGSAWPRLLWVAGSADSDGDQVRQVMKRVVGALRPITNSVRAPPPPTIPAKTRALLGAGGSGSSAWEARIEPLGGNAGFSMRFPWLQDHGKKGQGMHWESLEPRMLQQRGAYTLMDCLFWVPGNGLILSGLARKEVASVRFQLVEQPSVTVSTFGRDKGLPWVAYASPQLPAGTKVARVFAFDAAGQLVGGEEEPYGGESLCRPR